MSRFVFPALSLSLCLIIANPVGAQGDERREQVERLKREAMELIESGQKDRAEEMLKKVASLTQETDSEKMADQLRARSGVSPKPFRPDMVLKQPQPETARRLEHMRAAVEHLRQAGLVDPANHVNEMANQLQQEMHHEGRGRQGEGDPIREIMKQLGEMRREIDELRERLDRREK